MIIITHIMYLSIPKIGSLKLNTVEGATSSPFQGLESVFIFLKMFHVEHLLVRNRIYEMNEE